MAENLIDSITKKFVMGGSVPPPSDEIIDYLTEDIPKTGAILFLTLAKGGALRHVKATQEAFLDHGYANFQVICCDRLHPRKIFIAIKQAAVIMIGSGNTLRYRRFFFYTPIKKALLTAYHRGIPLAGFSAGSLMMPTKMLVSNKDNWAGLPRITSGLGLVDDCVIAVHYSRWHEESMLKKAVKRAKVSIGYGIDDGSYVAFENGERRIFGRVFFQYP